MEISLLAWGCLVQLSRGLFTASEPPKKTPQKLRVESHLRAW
jgi:hypothetical protein